MEKQEKYDSFVTFIHNALKNKENNCNFWIKNNSRNGGSLFACVLKRDLV